MGAKLTGDLSKDVQQAEAVPGNSPLRPGCETTASFLHKIYGMHHITSDAYYKHYETVLQVFLCALYIKKKNSVYLHQVLSPPMSGAGRCVDTGRSIYLRK